MQFDKIFCEKILKKFDQKNSFFIQYVDSNPFNFDHTNLKKVSKYQALIDTKNIRSSWELGLSQYEIEYVRKFNQYFAMKFLK